MMNRVVRCLPAILISSCLAEASGQNTRVEVVQPQRKTIRQVVEQPASLDAMETTPVYSRVAGYLGKVAVDMGDRVAGPKFDPQGALIAAGQPLAQVDLPEMLQDLRQKQAEISESRAQVEQAITAVRVNEAKSAGAKAKVSSAAAAIRRAKGAVAKLQSEHDRFVKLVAENAVAPKLVDETLQTLTSAQAGVAEAESLLESANADVQLAEALVHQAAADRVAAEAHVKVIEAAMERTKVMYEYGTIRAPFDGVVSKRLAHTGHYVHAGGQGTPLFEVTRIDTIRVFIDVPESHAAHIDSGDPVTIRFPSTPLPTLEAKITRISWTLDRVSRTLKAEADVPNPTGQLRPGMYAYAAIVVEVREQALALPISSVATDLQGSHCLVVVEGKLERRELKLGLRTATEVEVVDGLRENEHVVRTNQPGLSIGQTVDVAVVGS